MPGRVRDDSAGGGCLTARGEQKHARNPRGVIFAEGGTQEQTCVEGARTKSDLESLADNDIHRLVRVTAHKRLVQKTAR